MYSIGDWQLRFLGHDSFQLAGPEKTIYIDPYEISAGRPADYILISHEHYDHLDLASIDRLKQQTTVLVGSSSVAEQLGGAVKLLPGEGYEDDALTITATAAYNVGKQFHSKSNNNIGFVLDLPELRLYHAGDTDLIPEMGQLPDVTIALLPVSGTYVMTAEEAAEAARRIKPAVAIPMHYGSIIGDENDAQTFARLVGDTCEVIILEEESAI